MKREKSCGAVVFRKNEQNFEFLLIQHQAGHWGFPKGHVEKNEKEIETAIREVAEETGLNVEILPNFRESIEYRPRINHLKQVVYFVASVISGTPTPQESEIKTLGWYSFTDALEQLSFNNDRNILQIAVDYLTNLNRD